MRLLTAEKRVEMVHHLVECTGIRPTARLLKVDKNTVLSFLVKMGAGCLKLHDRLIRDLSIWRIETDELQAAMHTRQKNLRGDEPAEYGHVWTFTAFATVSKLLLAFRHGKRCQEDTDAFMWDLRRRLTVQPEIVSDGLVCYEAGVARSFGLACDYAMLIKTPSKKGRVSTIPFVQKKRVVGAPDMDRVSTSYVERMNSTIRDQTKRFARRSRFHSKKLSNHEAQFALFAAWYNMVRIHSTLKTTPACAAGIEKEPWTLARLIEEALSAEEAAPIEPQPLKPRAEVKTTAKQTSTGAWLRAIPGGKARPLAAVAPTKPRLHEAKRPMKQMDLFDLEYGC